MTTVELNTEINSCLKELSNDEKCLGQVYLYLKDLIAKKRQSAKEPCRYTKEEMRSCLKKSITDDAKKNSTSHMSLLSEIKRFT